MGSGEPVFGNLQEVEIVLSASTIPAADMHRLVMGQGELLLSVETPGVVVSVRVEKRSEGGFRPRYEKYNRCCMSVQQLC